MTKLDAEQDARGDLAAENRQLRATIAALREALEDARAENSAARRDLRSEVEGELVELRAGLV